MAKTKHRGVTTGRPGPDRPAPVTQAELDWLAVQARLLRRALEEYGMARRDLVVRLQRGAEVEPGRWRPRLVPMPAQLNRWLLVDRAAAAVQPAYLTGEAMDEGPVGLYFFGRGSEDQTEPEDRPAAGRPGVATTRGGHDEDLPRCGRLIHEPVVPVSFGWSAPRKLVRVI